MCTLNINLCINKYLSQSFLSFLALFGLVSLFFSSFLQCYNLITVFMRNSDYITIKLCNFANLSKLLLTFIVSCVSYGESALKKHNAEMIKLLYHSASISNSN